MDKGWTLDQLSKISGVRLTQLHKYETGLAYPRVDAAMKLAKALDVSVENLFEWAK